MATQRAQSTGFPDIFSQDEVESRVPLGEVVLRGSEPPQPTDQDRALAAAATLQRTFPRIHDQLERVWGTSAGEEYLDKLILDERGDRSGFPVSVMEAILILQRLHFKNFGTFRPRQPWDISSQN